MSFREFYNECQRLQPKVSRNDLKSIALKAAGVEKIEVRITTLDTKKCRGFYLSAINAEHTFVRQHGCSVIALARGMNKCWERFVFVKELMHIFDTKEEMTDTGEAFDQLLNELVVPNAAGLSPQFKSEVDCFWMALSAFCPESKRREYAAQLLAGTISHSDIAEKLKIPAQHTHRLFGTDYTSIISRLTK